MFFLINKPIGISSFGAIARLRKILGIKKVGHTGTLDPLASGLLLVATGNSTKLISYIDKARKTYIFTVRLDGTTASLDLDTPVQFLDQVVLDRIGKTLTIKDIEKIIADDFSGVIEQIPPAYSAIRIDGERAYKLIREGKEVVMKARRVEIFSSRVVSFDFPEVTIEMEVSAGTYIRSIARDL
ncbi:MAG: tRNA pseudouridine(55) synthase TruB, partial [Candidatus Gracilibacteria bacterium]|nr:tRNA pseudouridine(55) synthase TruB [Candidatus Gracilibacteria bacterium]